MSSLSPTQRDIEDDGKQLRTTTFIHRITEEGNKEDAQQPEHSRDDPSITRPERQIAGQQYEEINSAPTKSAEPSSPANPSSATPASEQSIISPLGRPPPSSHHYYLKEKWPGQPICHLCHKEYKKTNRSIRALPCGDIFHRRCIDHLLGRQDGRCPSSESSVPAAWYISHKYDPAKPAGSPCLCHPDVTAGTTTTKINTKSEGSSSTPPGVLASQKLYRRTKETMVRYTLGQQPRTTYVRYKTETGQTRYIKRETGDALPGPRSGHTDE